MKSITLCADDYGQNTAISQAIIALLKEKKLSATSCMTTTTHWLTHAAWLSPFKEQADIGIHLNLTQGTPLSSDFKKAYGNTFPSLSKLLLKCYLQQWNPSIIYAELDAQLTQFKEGVGRLPDFFDGHQHVHQFPIIRDAVLKLYQDRLPYSCYIRSVYDATAWRRIHDNAYIKRLIIQLCGASSFKHQLTRLKIPHNTSFSGIYDFNQANNYAELFPHFLEESLDSGIIMCHPGLPHEVNQEKDEIMVSRPYEYRYFLSDTFDLLCKEHKIIIGRFHK